MIKDIANDVDMPIGKVAKIVGVETHTIRFWQKNFPNINCKIGKGDRRYYNKKAIECFLLVKKLMYEDGMTISGANKIIQKNSRINRSKINNIQGTNSESKTEELINNKRVREEYIETMRKNIANLKLIKQAIKCIID